MSLRWTAEAPSVPFERVHKLNGVRRYDIGIYKEIDSPNGAPKL